MNSPWGSSLETILNVIVNSKISFNQVSKIFSDFICIFIKKPLKFGDIFKFIEVFFKLGIKI